MSNSILEATKLYLGIPIAHTEFDVQVLMGINSALSTLSQLGVGPTEGFTVVDATDIWADVIGVDSRLNSVQQYVYLKTKMVFDPPEIGFVLTNIKETIKELEWRLNVTVDNEIPTDEGEEALA